MVSILQNFLYCIWDALLLCCAWTSAFSGKNPFKRNQKNVWEGRSWLKARVFISFKIYTHTKQTQQKKLKHLNYLGFVLHDWTHSVPVKRYFNRGTPPSHPARPPQIALSLSLSTNAAFLADLDWGLFGTQKRERGEKKNHSATTEMNISYFISHSGGQPLTYGGFN